MKPEKSRIYSFFTKEQLRKKAQDQFALAARVKLKKDLYESDHCDEPMQGAEQDS